MSVPLAELVDALGDAGSDTLFAHFVGRAPTAAELKALETYRASRVGDTAAEIVALVLSSPAFQMH